MHVSRPPGNQLAGGASLRPVGGTRVGLGIPIYYRQPYRLRPGRGLPCAGEHKQAADRAGGSDLAPAAGRPLAVAVGGLPARDLASGAGGCRVAGGPGRALAGPGGRPAPGRRGRAAGPGRGGPGRRGRAADRGAGGGAGLPPPAPGGHPAVPPLPAEASRRRAGGVAAHPLHRPGGLAPGRLHLPAAHRDSRTVGRRAARRARGGGVHRQPAPGHGAAAGQRPGGTGFRAPGDGDAGAAVPDRRPGPAPAVRLPGHAGRRRGRGARPRAAAGRAGRAAARRTHRGNPLARPAGRRVRGRAPPDR